MAKNVLIERNGTQRNNQNVIDFDQLSKFEKSPSIRMPFVIVGVSEGSVNTSLESKDLVLS
jgi:regulator of sigma E protease